MLWCLLQECLFFLGYVTGRSEFPKPLTKQQEAEVVARYAAGDEEARRLLIEHNLRLVSHIAHKYTVPGYGQDDLISIGVIGLIKAVNNFRPESGAALGTYAARCIENAILTPPRQTGRQQNPAQQATHRARADLQKKEKQQERAVAARSCCFIGQTSASCNPRGRRSFSGT